MMWSDWGWSFGEGANFYFSLSEGLKIEFFLALSGRESSLVQTFCESCEQLDITHPSIHMTRRFVIQGCPTLMTHLWQEKLICSPAFKPPALKSPFSLVLDCISYHKIDNHICMCTHYCAWDLSHAQCTPKLHT